jgi:hypothetical protein
MIWYTLNSKYNLSVEFKMKGIILELEAIIEEWSWQGEGFFFLVQCLEM